MRPAPFPDTSPLIGAETGAIPVLRIPRPNLLLLLFPNIPGGGAAGAGGQRPPLQEIRTNFLVPNQPEGAACG